MDKTIDKMIKGYLYQTADKGITLGVEADSLENVSEEIAVKVVKLIKECFREIMKQPSGSTVLFNLKHTKMHIKASATKDDKLIYNNLIPLQDLTALLPKKGGMTDAAHQAILEKLKRKIVELTEEEIAKGGND